MFSVLLPTSYSLVAFNQCVRRQCVQRALIIMCMLISACKADIVPVPVGTWKAVESNRYMSIKPAQTQPHLNTRVSKLQGLQLVSEYEVMMYSYHDKTATEFDPSFSSAPSQLFSANNKNLIKLERIVESKMINGVLTLQSRNVDIPLLYHPSGDRVLVNGDVEFRRAPTLATQKMQAKNVTLETRP